MGSFDTEVKSEVEVLVEVLDTSQPTQPLSLHLSEQANSNEEELAPEPAVSREVVGKKLRLQILKKEHMERDRRANELHAVEINILHEN